MNIVLIQFAVQSIVRLSQVGKDIAEQRARNTPALLPGLDPQDLSRNTVVNGFFTSSAWSKEYVAEGGEYAEFWDGDQSKTDKNSIDSLYVGVLKISASQGMDFEAALTPSGTTLLAQFDPGKDPNLSPFARIALTAADIVLDYLAVDPSIASDNPNSQKMIAAFAAAMADFLPDNGDFGPKEKFGERLASGFLRAGLKTITTHPDWVVEKEHVSTLLKNSLKPVIESFPSTIAGQIQWNRVTESIIGPAAQAALETIAANQKAFLGDRFDPDKAMGAVTQALLVEAAENGLHDQFTKEGLIGLYQATLAVAKVKPELFIVGNTPKHELARDALKSFASVLESSPPPFDHETGITLFAIAIEIVGENAHRFADPKNDWHGVAVKVFENLTASIAQSVKDNEGLKNAISREQLVEVGRIVLTEITTNPTLITHDAKEWNGVIAAISKAMTADEHLLLTGEDWKVIASIAATEAAANPARLFKMGSSPEEVLGAKLLNLILKAASKALLLEQGKEHTVLVGKTLREAINIILVAASGNAKAILANMNLLGKLLDELNELAVAFPMEIGSKEWLHLLRLLLGPTLDGTPVGNLDIERAIRLLKGE